MEKIIIIIYANYGGISQEIYNYSFIISEDKPLKYSKSDHTTSIFCFLILIELWNQLIYLLNFNLELEFFVKYELKSQLVY